MSNFPSKSDVFRFYYGMESEEARQELLRALRAQLQTVQEQRSAKQEVLIKVQQEMAVLFLDEKRIVEQIDVLSSDKFVTPKEADNKVCYELIMVLKCVGYCKLSEETKVLKIHQD